MDVLPALPSELWSQTFEYLGKADLKAVRLCGKRQWETLASPLLFTTAYVAARRGVLDTFTELITHPAFRHYVKEVVFDISWLDPKIVEEYADDERGGLLTQMFCEQERIQECELQSRLDSAFQSLCAVKRVYYANMSTTSCLPGDQNDPSWCSDYEEGPLWRRIELTAREDVFCAYCMKTGTEFECSRRLSDEEDSNAITSCGVVESHCRLRRRQGGLIILMQVLSKHATATLVDLSLCDEVYACWGDVGISPLFFSPDNPADTHPFFFPVFRCLRKLDLTISKPTLHRREPIDLVELLSSAKNLEELKLLSDRYGDVKHLNPANTLAKQSQLEDFLHRHASSLRNMTLDNFRLVQGTWEPFLANLPKISPEVQLIFGAVAWQQILFGSMHSHRQKEEKCEDRAEEEEEEDESSSEDLEYISDDSSSETDEPRRKPDADLLIAMDAESRRKVEYLQHELPGCPVQVCQIMLVKAMNDENLARRAIIERYGYDELEGMSSEMRANVEKLTDELPCHCSATEVKGALERSGFFNQLSSYW